MMKHEMNQLLKNELADVIIDINEYLNNFNYQLITKLITETFTKFTCDENLM